MVFLSRKLNSPPSGSKQLIPVPAEISINIGISYLLLIFLYKDLLLSFADIFVQGGMKMLALLLKN